MRALLTSLPYYSHLVSAVLPVAGALRRAGHSVAVATAPAMAETVVGAGVEHLPLPNVRTLAELLADPEFASAPGMPGAAKETPEERASARTRPGRLTLARAGALAGIFARDVVDAGRRWRPDVIVREGNEFGGYLAAERLGLPRAVLDIAPLNAHHLPFVHESLNGERVALGLDPVDDPWHPNRGLLAGIAPRPWYPATLPVHPTRCYRPDEVTTRLPGAFADLPADRPLVLAGLGTIASDLVPEAAGLLTTMVTALGELPCTAVISLGSESAVRDWSGPRPGNVRLVPFVPLAPLLGTAELFLSHAGFGGVLEALRAGTPMVTVPLLGDQELNSRRIEDLGCGRHVEVTGVTSDLLAETCERVLADRTFRYRTAAMARRIGADPGYGVLADDLAALC